MSHQYHPNSQFPSAISYCFNNNVCPFAPHFFYKLIIQNHKFSVTNLPLLLLLCIKIQLQVASFDNVSIPFFFVASDSLFFHSFRFPLLSLPQPLISAKGELDDLHLFREAISKAKATAASSKISHLGTINPNPKIAFLFLTNSDLVFAPLWQRFFQSSNAHLFNVYVHADPSTKLSTPEWLLKANFIPAKTTARASPTLISAARRLMANAIIDDPFNLYFALVSQHCIPLHSFKFVYASLFGNPLSAPKAFLNQRSHKSYIEILSEAPYLHNRYVARGDGSLLPEIPYDSFRVGSQFFVLAKRHALLVLKERKLWRKFKQPCLDLDSCYPEEHYFPTLLSMEDPKGSSLYTLTRVNWTDTVDGHPHTYLSPEISPELIHTLRKSNSSFSYFFARKFSPECLQPLMEIANDVIFRD